MKVHHAEAAKLRGDATFLAMAKMDFTGDCSLEFIHACLLSTLNIKEALMPSDPENNVPSLLCPSPPPHLLFGRPLMASSERQSKLAEMNSGPWAIFLGKELSSHFSIFFLGNPFFFLPSTIYT